ncbi:Multidrug export protein mepA [uncultured Roseburia sp.]|uniref:Multidrug export protein MepA n=1 Tax=Brotonthovivens ammoniilytica TaxID=2981725 RepID=A0ABT2THX3_9FIRM|nr:MATE family efflux transporter [Brotonthovivens ammoniilytica]MCU6761798.1 MATE family efflux transporter [Brotonthovivens ammoniilytica]SCI47020.1 Multidrug export protein mepA [uncultured Roseburia sp.]
MTNTAAVSDSTQNPLGYEKLPKLLRNFAIPSVIAMLVTSLYNIVDQIFIGQGVGYLGNAATNVAYPLTTICLAIALLIGIGGAARFSLELGAGNKEKAEHSTGNAITLMILCGVVYLVIIQIFIVPMLNIFGSTPDVLPYAVTYTRITAFGMPLLIITNGLSNLARADGSPKYSMVTMLLGAIINTILDPIFIFVFDMGIGGAALATIIGQAASCIMALLYIPKFRNIHLKKKYFRLKGSICRQIIPLGMSNSFNQLALTLVQIVFNNSLTYYGAMSVYGTDIPLACCGIVMKVNAVLVSIIIGIAQGCQPIIGFNYGAKKYPRVKGIYKLAICCALIICSIGFIIFQFFPEPVISIFGSGSPEYMEFAVKFMRTFLFMVPVLGIQILSANFFTAIGKAMKGLFLSLTRQVLFLIPLILILPIKFGIEGILYSAPIADIAAFIVAVLLITKELRHMNQTAAQLEQESK